MFNSSPNDLLEKFSDHASCYMYALCKFPIRCLFMVIAKGGWGGRGGCLIGKWQVARCKRNSEHWIEARWLMPMQSDNIFLKYATTTKSFSKGRTFLGKLYILMTLCFKLLGKQIFITYWKLQKLLTFILCLYICHCLCLCVCKDKLKVGSTG